MMESKAMESRQVLADGFERGLGSNSMASKARTWTISNSMGSKRMGSNLMVSNQTMTISLHTESIIS